MQLWDKWWVPPACHLRLLPLKAPVFLCSPLLSCWHGHTTPPPPHPSCASLSFFTGLLQKILLRNNLQILNMSHDLLPLLAFVRQVLWKSLRVFLVLLPPPLSPHHRQASQIWSRVSSIILLSHDHLDSHLRFILPTQNNSQSECSILLEQPMGLHEYSLRSNSIWTWNSC